MTDCLVYFFTGFLDAGKTSFINEWIGSENFRDKKIVVIATEEGEEEFDSNKFPGVKLNICTVDTDDICKELMFDIDKKYKPDVIFMEWNGSVSPAEFFDKVDVPRRWALAAAVVIIDASTYTDYYKNMQTIFADYFRFCDTIIFNRVDPAVNNIPKLRGSVKSINPGANVNFISTTNDFLDIGDYLPYDLNANPCVISADDFGLFWTDALDNVDKYNGKRISVIGQAIIYSQFKNRAFALQRQAYTCCADDMGQINLLCYHEFGSGFPAGQWLKVTGTVRYFEDKQNGQTVAVPCLTVDDYSITSKPDNEIIYFS